MAAVPDVQRLQARVEELERWVYGPGGARGSRKVSDLGAAGPSEAETGGLLACASMGAVPVPSPTVRPLK